MEEQEERTGMLAGGAKVLAEASLPAGLQSLNLYYNGLGPHGAGWGPHGACLTSAACLTSGACLTLGACPASGACLISGP